MVLSNLWKLSIGNLMCDERCEFYSHLLLDKSATEQGVMLVLELGFYLEGGRLKSILNEVYTN